MATTIIIPILDGELQLIYNVPAVNQFEAPQMNKRSDGLMEREVEKE
jgi:hypothetical protein